MIYKQEEVNLHTHSFYCGHGTGQLYEFATKARGTFKVLGFSEHQCVPDDDMPSRMPFAQFDNYIADIDRLKNSGCGANDLQTADVGTDALKNSGCGANDLQIAGGGIDALKNSGCGKDGLQNVGAGAEKSRNSGDGSERVIVLKGAECDWEVRYLSFYKDYVLGEKAFDYALGAVHFVTTKDGELKYIPSAKEFDLNDLKWYVSNYIAMIESGLFLIACHPDLFFGGYKKWDEEALSASKDIISCAISNKIPLEMNDLGLRKRPIETNIGLRHQYTIPEFWEIARDMGAIICTNTDAHNPKDTCGKPKEGFQNQSFWLANKLGIKFVSWDVDEKGGGIRYVIPS